MSRNPKTKEAFYVQIDKEEADLLKRAFIHKQWSKSKIIRKIVRWYLGERGIMSKVDMPK